MDYYPFNDHYSQEINIRLCPKDCQVVDYTGVDNFVGICSVRFAMNARFDYKYPLDQCDVSDKDSCQKFRDKRQEWMECLIGDDPHAISKQLSSVVWDYTLFCTVNELRRAAEDENDDSAGFNGPVIRMWDAGFASLQATAIRRLIEKPKTNPNWAVISIRSVLKDIEDNLGLITRENYVCYDGLPYDYDAVHDKWLASLPKTKSGVHAGVMPTTGPTAWHSSQMHHESFDRLFSNRPK